MIPFVKMKRSAGFYQYAWDTVVGCKNGCDYCYARKKFSRNPNRKFERIMFFNDLWDEPGKVDPCMIFVNHFTDIMGEWVSDEWINRIIKVAKSLPEHEFLFMTKLPDRYTDFEFSDNCILGVTIESPAEWWRAEVMKQFTSRKMASVEPILGDFTGYDFSQFELVVVGALITFDKSEPDKRFYDTVKHPNIYYNR